MMQTMTDNSGSVMMDSRFNRNLNLTEYERQIRLAHGLSVHSPSIH
mgnify:FL=1